VICKKFLDNGKPRVNLGEAGAKPVNRSSTQSGDHLVKYAEQVYAKYLLDYGTPAASTIR